MLSISATPPSRYEEVLSFLLGHLSEQERVLQLKELLDSAKKNQLDLSGLIMATDEGKVCGATLSIIQPDQSAFVWTPIVAKIPHFMEVENRLLQFLGDQLDSKNVWMGQCIVDLDAKSEREVLQRNQFDHVADLVYMNRLLLKTIPESEILPDLKSISYSEDENYEKFKEVLGRTYHDTLDCTFLNDLRTHEESLESHQLSGDFLPAQWRVFHDGQNDIGLLLMNDHPDQDAWEIVYIGVVPEARGKGYGREIVLSGLNEALQADRMQVILAVDVKNPYAYKLYESLGFLETTRKSVHIRVKKS